MDFGIGRLAKKGLRTQPGAPMNRIVDPQKCVACLWADQRPKQETGKLIIVVLNICTSVKFNSTQIYIPACLVL